MSATYDKSVVIVGTGYVGLPAAMMLAKAGVRVLGVDLNENIVRAINERILPISEVDLQAVMADPVVHENLAASTGVSPGDVYIIAVPTPLHPRKKVSDLSYVESALASIVPHLKKGDLVIIESTIPPLTCRELAKPIIEAATGLSVPGEVMLAHCPERILPGNIFHEIVHNDRVIGGMDDASSRAASEVYATFVKGGLYLTDDVTAEMCKLMENTYRDVNIALSNELSEVCRTLGIETGAAFDLANKHPRVNFLSPGIGVGGHCIPIDPWFINEVDPANTTIIEAARRINDARPARIAARIRETVASVPDPRIVAIGAAYKADTEDLRESPALEVVRLLKADGYRVDHYEPTVPEMAYESLEIAAGGADALVILVPHTAVRRELTNTRPAIEAAMRTSHILEF